MSLEINKICRTCLALEGALLSIYDSKGTSGGHDCVADMLGDLTSNPPKKSDGMPEKVCIACISEINRCYTFKMRCDNSDRTLRQLLNITKQPEQSEEHQEGVEQMKVEKSVATEVADEKKKPQKRKADHSLKVLHEEVEPEPSGETNEVYSVQAEEELETSYFVIRAPDDESEGDEDKQETQSDGHSEGYEELLHKFVTQSQEHEEDGVLEEIDDSDAYKPPVRRAPQRKKEELKCVSCPMTFVHPRNLEKHISKYHNSREVTYTQSKHPLVSDKKNVVDEVSTPQAEEETENFEVEFQSIEETDETAVAEDPQLLKELVKVEMHSHNCPYCGASFALQKSLNIHMKWSKCTEKQYSCSKCQKVFISNESLNRHIRTHKEEFSCDVCSETFTQKEELNEHKAKKHNFKAKNKCPICNKVFSMLSTLKDHMRIHSGERPFLCSLCGKGFSQNANLKQHVMRHNKNKPFKCDQCPRAFVSKGELYSHVRSHTGDHPFVCDICKAAFTTSSSLVKHKRIHTGERPYACDFCPMRFSALNTLKNHRRTHTGEKPYKCKYCERGFAQKSDCDIHMRTHTGERRYICQICGSAFYQSGTLRTHMKTHNRVKANAEEVEQSTSVIGLADGDEEMDEDQSQEQMDEQKKSTSTMEVTVDLGEDDILNFAIEECSSENNDFNAE